MADGNTMKNDIAMFGVLMLGLLGLMIITGVTFVVSDEFKSALCESVDASTNYVWTGNECQVSSTNTTEVTLNSLTYVSSVEAAIVLAIGFLSIVVLILIAKLLFKVTKSFSA